MIAGLAGLLESYSKTPVERQEETIRGFPSVERQLTALQLALSPGWLHLKRNAFTHESHADRHTRPMTVLQLFMTQLFVLVLHFSGQQDGEWAILQ
jgi:hypothetical protein